MGSAAEESGLVEENSALAHTGFLVYLEVHDPSPSGWDSLFTEKPERFALDRALRALLPETCPTP